MAMATLAVVVLREAATMVHTAVWAVVVLARRKVAARVKLRQPVRRALLSCAADG